MEISETHSQCHNASFVYRNHDTQSNQGKNAIQGQQNIRGGGSDLTDTHLVLQKYKREEEIKNNQSYKILL